MAIDFIDRIGSVTFEKDVIDPLSYQPSFSADVIEDRDVLTGDPVVRSPGAKAPHINATGSIRLDSPQEAVQRLLVLNTLLSYVGTEQQVSWRLGLRKLEIWMVESISLESRQIITGTGGQGKLLDWDMSMVYVSSIPEDVGTEAFGAVS